MPRVDPSIPYSLLSLLDRYRCTRKVLARWLEQNMGNDHHGHPVTVLHLLEKTGYAKGKSYFTPKQWEIVTHHLDPILRRDES